MRCDEFDEIAGAYALGALPADEMDGAASHLATCHKHPEIVELAAVAASLAAGAPEMDPPPALKSRLIAAVHADIAAEASRSDESIKSARDGHRGGGLITAILSWLSGPRLGYTMSATLAVVVAALVVWNLSIDTGSSAGTPTTVVTLSGAASGHVAYYEADGVAIMDIEGLEPPSPGHVYQVWAVSAGQPASLGTLEVSEGGVAQAAMTGVSFDGVDTIAVTVEQAPGADQPTTEPIISGNL